MISLFKNPVSHEGLQNAQVRKKWDNRKFITRFIFAIIATTAILIGLEFASPHYSISTTVVEHVLAKSETLRAVIESNWLRDFFVREFDEGKQLPVYSGSSLKFAVFFLVFLLISVHFLSNDPLSNSELLRNLVKKSSVCKPPYPFRWMSEIGFYANHLPSNRLPERCEKCRTNGCGNRLAYGEDRKTYHWNSIFSKLSPSLVNSILYSTHKCRYIFFLRYSAWVAVIVLVPAYILARLFELTVVGEVSANWVLLGYVFSLWFFGVIVGHFNSAEDVNGHGVWGHFAETVGNLFHLDEFKEAYDGNVCKYERKAHEFSNKEGARRIMVSGDKIQRLVTLVGYLDEVVKNKALRALSGNATPGDKESLKAILTALVEMLQIVNQEEIQFRCAIFVEDREQKYLVPLATVPFRERPFHTLEQKDYLESKLALNSDCVASRAWQTRRVISSTANEISYFHEAQRKYLKSMIAIPLVIDPAIRERLSEIGEELGELAGVLTVDSDSESYFSVDAQESNLVEIMPFVNRLIFEMVYSAANKEKRNA